MRHAATVLYSLAVGGTVAVGAKQLHHTGLAAAASKLGLAGRLLHGNGGDHDGRNVVLARRGVKLVKVGSTGSVDAVGGQVLVLDLVKGEEGRVPSVVVDATVEPPLLAVGVVGVGLVVTAGAGGSVNCETDLFWTYPVV